MKLQPLPNVGLDNFDLAKYPSLKPGVQFFRVAGEDCSDVYVGFSNRGIELKFEIAFELLALFDGSRSLGSIISEIDTDSKSRDFIPEALQVLSAERLIEFRSSQLPKLLLKKELQAINVVNSSNRMRAEENLYSWHPDVSAQQDTQTLIGHRRNFSIIIYGRNRLALSLFAVLQASGFALVKLTDRSGSVSGDSGVQIEPSEVCGLAIRGSDVGLRKALVIADLARNSQLFPLKKLEFPLKPDFIISTESIPQETMQLWLSDAIAHLPISNLVENRVVVGPIVIPGETPCLNCLSLWRSDQFPHHNSFEILTALDSGEGKGLELPSAQVALLTGLIATHVIQFCTSQNSAAKLIGTSKLIGTTLAINLFDPIDSGASSSLDNQTSLGNQGFGYRYWQPHPSCGCQQLI